MHVNVDCTLESSEEVQKILSFGLMQKHFAFSRAKLILYFVKTHLGIKINC